MKQYVEINVIHEQIGERFGFPVEDAIENLPIANDVQEKKYCRMIPHKPDCRGCTDVFICTNCQLHIHLGFISKNYGGNYCIECGAEVEDGDENGD